MASIQKGTQSSLSEINMVPFVDVVLVLLIIFMITAPILQSGIELNVPKTHAVHEAPEQRIVVSMDKNQLVYLGNTPVKVYELGAKIKALQKGPEDAVFLRCDQSVSFGAFANIVDALRMSGINNISIVTEPITDHPQTK